MKACPEMAATADVYPQENLCLLPRCLDLLFHCREACCCINVYDE